MMLVPLLLGLAVLGVAVAARAQSCHEGCDEVDPGPRLHFGRTGWSDSGGALVAAFPGLRMWQPTRAWSDLAACGAGGSDKSVTRGRIGPDIVIRPVPMTQPVKDRWSKAA